MKYLTDNCFKIHIHIMPDLPGSTPDIDKEMFDYVDSCLGLSKMFDEIVIGGITGSDYEGTPF